MRRRSRGPEEEAPATSPRRERIGTQTMRKQALRRSTFLSLLGFKTPAAAAQPAAPAASAAPMTVTPSPAQSTTNLLSFSASAETLVPAPSSSSRSRSALSTDELSFTVNHAEPSRGTTARAGRRAQPAREESAEIVYMSQAVPVGYRRMGLAGALAGAAGVFLV